MKTQKTWKKLLSSILMAIIILGQFSSFHFTSKAEVIITEEGDSLYLKLSRTNEDATNPIGYGFGMDAQGGAGKVIWSFMSGDSNNQNYKYATNLYCIKAENGATWGTNQTQMVIYNKSYDIPLAQNTESTVANEMLTGTYSNEILWIIDNMYIPGESTEEDLKAYLKAAGIEYIVEEGGYIYTPTTNHNYVNIPAVSNTYLDTVTEEDIVAIQQMAIWYYTNHGENSVYNKLGDTPYLQYTENGTNYFELTSTITSGSGRGPHAQALYNYLVNEARNVADALAEGEKYTLKNKTAKVWLAIDSATGADKAEQPVIEVHPKPEKQFDLVLRKAIVSVNDGETAIKNTSGADATRPLKTDKSIQTVDTSKLNTTDTAGVKTTTADYNHRKDPVVVNKGDKVTYSITIYNEGEQAGYATKIVDQLPGSAGTLRLDNEMTGTITSSIGNTYEVGYSATTNQITLTMVTESTKYPIPAYNEETGEISYETILLDCIVAGKPDAQNQKILTNIAYIAEEFNSDEGVTITANTTQDRDSQTWNSPIQTGANLVTTDIGYTGKTNKTQAQLANNEHHEGEQDDDDFEKIVVLPKTFDLKLIKYITSINEEQTGNRVLSVDTSKLNTVDAEGKIITTAEYILEKNPVSVKAGDFVTYTFRIYNEGDYDGYATEISEDIPEGLEFIAVGDEQIWSWDGTTLEDITEEIKESEMYETIVNTNSVWGYKQDSSAITTTALSEELIKAFGKENAEYADAENKIDYKEISVIFRVKQDVESNIVIRNEAAISADKAVDDSGNEVNISDRDSTPDEWKKEDSGKDYDKEGKWPIYKEDDEDYDNIVTKAFDLALRKQIIQINDGLYTKRFAKLDSSNQYGNTIYDYYDVYSEKPKVKAGDIVTYSIRVYNEGKIDGYASLIVDKLPSGLEFVEYEEGDGSINDTYGWVLKEGTTDTYQTDYLSYEKDANKGTSKSTILKAYTGEGEASYQEIYIECRVKEDVTKEDSLLNVAQIAEDSDENGNPIKDKDSNPGSTDDEQKWKEEDDLDIEILELQEFDLALRKFITEIENGEKIKEVTTRIPQVSYDEEKEQLVYTHPKDALVVHVGDTVIYTLRIYNEGDIDGYASEVKDDIPEYLEYLPEHKTNIENEWEMYDEEGKVTEDVEKAVCIRTEHLAKGKGAELEKAGANLIEAFDKDTEISETNPHYKELQVAFKVKDPNSTEYEIVNFAQISEDTDKDGDPIKDRDSDPDNGEGDPKEDDEDIEKVKVEYFDLALLKYVTKVMVNENGEVRETLTGNVGDENDIIPHVQINKKNIHKTVVKFAYTIKITNEGQIAGEATEITDYVPEGLVFKAEDNPNWKDEGNNVISTRQLMGIRLEPGESAEVEVILTWINGDDNLGPKTNVAEISEDYNEENVPDRDSTPDNKVEGEDDIDEATVLLSVNQGGGIPSLYRNLALIFLSIIFIGGILIKKFVL